MGIGYGDVLKKKRASNKTLLIICASAVLIIGGMLIVATEYNIIAVIISAAVFAAVAAGLLFKLRSTDKSIAKMLEGICIPDPDAINALLSEAQPLNDGDILMLMTREYLLNFNTLHAYELTDITSIYKTDGTDPDTNIKTSYYVNIKCANRSFKSDSFLFVSAAPRDAAYDRILEAYRLAGGKEDITERR